MSGTLPNHIIKSCNSLLVYRRTHFASLSFLYFLLNSQFFALLYINILFVRCILVTLDVFLLPFFLFFILSLLLLLLFCRLQLCFLQGTESCFRTTRAVVVRITFASRPHWKVNLVEWMKTAPDTKRLRFSKYAIQLNRDILQDRIFRDSRQPILPNVDTVPSNRIQNLCQNIFKHIHCAPFEVKKKHFR